MRIKPVCSLKWAVGSSSLNSATEFIRDHYHQHFGASIFALLPYILTLCDGEGHLLATCGVMPASQGTLFLEQYLNQPAEITLQQHGFSNTGRDGIVEAGNFAAVDGAATRVMYAAVCLLLNHYRYRYIMFTGTRKIRNTFSRLHLQPVCLAAADRSRLSDNPEGWGRYYEHTPQVMAGDLSGGQKALAESSLLFNLFGELPAAPWQPSQEIVCHAN